MLSRWRINEWEKKKSQSKTFFFFYQLWSAKVRNKATVSKFTGETARKSGGHCKETQNDQGSVPDAGLYTNVFKFKKKWFHWFWQRRLKKASPDHWIPSVGRALPLRWEQSIVTILSHLRPHAPVRTVWEQETTAWTPCFLLSMALLITHLSPVHPLSHSSLPRACSLLEIPGWRTHDWEAIYKTVLRRGLCSGQPLALLAFLWKWVLVDRIARYSNRGHSEPATVSASSFIGH